MIITLLNMQKLANQDSKQKVYYTKHQEMQSKDFVYWWKYSLAKDW